MVATSAETPQQSTAAHVRGLLPVALGLCLIVFAFSLAFLPSIQWIAGKWSGSSGALSHGYLVAAISAVLFVRAIPDVAAIRVAAAWWMMPMLIGMSLVWLLGSVANAMTLQTIVLPAILLACIVMAYGLGASRPLVFPILFVYFALPAWDYAQFIFQAATVSAVGVLIRLAGIPALLEGNFVQLTSGTFEVAKNCSGFRYVIVGLSLATLYGHLYYSRLSQNLRLVLLMLAIAMIGNWIRVFIVIVRGYQTEMQSSLVNDHITLGWTIFAVLLVPVFFAARRIEEHGHYPESDTAPESSSKGNLIPIVMAVLVMLVGPVWSWTVTQSNVEEEVLQLGLPSGIDPWSGPNESQWGWLPKFSGPDAERVAQYGSDEAFVLVYTNLYLDQVQSKELVYYSNRIVGDWREVKVKSNSAPTVTVADVMSFRQVVASNYVGDWLIWYRYQVGDQFETTDTGAIIAQALKTLQGQSEAGVIAFAAPCRKSCDKAAETLEDFVDHVGYEIRVDFSR